MCCMENRAGLRRGLLGSNRSLSLLGVLGLLLLVVATGKGCATERATAPYLLPGDSFSGMGVFSSKGCRTCHSLPGEPRKLGPVLGGVPGRSYTEADIAASLWNHMPAMSHKMAELSLKHPPFTTTEMADLFAFLYYLSVLDPVGDASHGRWLFLEKGCDACHAVTLDGEPKVGPALPYWRAHTSPIRLAQAMWNHAVEMQSEMAPSGMPWVKLDKSDMADLVAYVRQVNKIAVEKPFLVGNQVRGRKVFVARGCADCHGVHRGENKVGPSLDEMNGAARRVGELGAVMWNHFPAMNALLGDSSSRRLRLSVAEMSDLFAYLFSVGYFDETGDPTRGRAVFVAKKCATCHKKGGAAGAPVGHLPGSMSLIALATALWNHGPQMMAATQKAGLDWPELTHDQILDLAAYLGAGD